MDRESTVVSKCQVSFINIIVTPLFEAWQAFARSDEAEHALANCKLNADEWRRCGEERIPGWLQARALERSDPLLADHGPRTDPLSDLAPVSAREHRFHHECVTEYRARKPPEIIRGSTLAAPHVWRIARGRSKTSAQPALGGEHETMHGASAQLASNRIMNPRRWSMRLGRVVSAVSADLDHTDF
jgi:hypothetical protein